MMKRRNFNLIKTGRKSKLALAVGLALAMSAMGSVYASGNDDTFKNFANKDALMKAAEGFKTQEFKNSTGLEAIGADKAYALGYSGKGITVGMVDTPVYSKHSELSGDKKIQKYGYGSDDLFSIFNDRDHGTHVAGIIAANKDEKGMHGIAYDANLISLGAKPLPDGGHNDPEAYTLYINNIKDAKVINNSWSFKGDNIDLSIEGNIEIAKKHFGNYYDYYNTLIDATKQYDQVNVYTSGNEGSIFSHAYTSGVGIFDEMKNNIVNVMSMNSHTGNLSSFSCLAKNAEDWTVVAPGTGINSLDAGALFSVNYTKGDGTSAAAPYVSGTLALIKEAFPYLSGKQIVETLLSTCNDKFLEDNYTVLLNTDGNNNLVAINLVYIDELEKQSDEKNKKALEKYYNATIKNEAFFKTICDKYGIKNAEDFIRLFSENEIGKIYYLTGKEAYGYGMVDAGKAVQGIGKIITSRLKSQDKSNIFTKESDVYLYSVDTGKKDANYKNRDYTIWSNDIGEELSADGLHAGITKKGEVDLVLLGDNTYLGPTISKDGKIQIVRGVSGNTFAIDNGIIEINGKANEVYSLNGGSTVVKDNITQKEQKPLELYGRSNADFYNSALPNTNKVDINGGLFAIGKNSITGEGSTINVNLTRSDSAIKGALYQDELGKINLSLANEAKFILQQGTGYYAGNSYKSNDTINNLTLNNSGEFDLSKDRYFTKLTVNNLNGYNGIFSLNTDLKNNSGDMIIVRNAEGDVLQNLKIYDKNLFDVSNVDNPLLVVQAPSNVIFSGILMDEGISKWTPIITKSNGENGQSKWFFLGYTNDVNYDNPYMTARVKSYYTTDDTINKGIEATTNRYNTIHVVDVEQSKGEAFQIKSLNAHKSAISGNVQFINSGKVKLTAEHNSKGLFLDEFAGISTEKGNFSAQQDFSIDMLDSYSRKTVAIHNIKQADLNGNLDISLSASQVGVGILNSGNFKSHHNVNIISDRDAIVGVDNSGDMIIDGDLTLKDIYNEDNEYRYYSGILNRNEQGAAKIYVSGDVNIELSNNDAERYYYAYGDIHNYRNTPEKFVQGIFNKGGTIIVDGAIRMTNSDEHLDGIVNYSGNMIIGSIDSAIKVKNYGSMEIKNQAKDIYVENGGNLILPNISFLSYLRNYGEIYGEKVDIKGDFYQGDGKANVTDICVNGKLTLEGGENKFTNLTVTNIKEDKVALEILTYGKSKTEIKNLKINNNGINFNSVYKETCFDIANDCYIENENVKNNAIDKNYGDGDFGELNINSSGKGTVQIMGEFSDNGSWTNKSFKTTKINLSNSDSFITTYIGGGDGLELKMSNGAILELSDNVDGKSEYKRKYYRIGNIDLSLKAIIALSTLNSKSGLEIYRTKLGKEFNVMQLSGTDGIIRIGIMQDENMRGSITSDIFSIRKNITEGAKHIVQLLPMQADFLLTNDTKINPFTIIEDSSEKNGGYKLDFTINPFDAGAYNYTPTLTNEKSKDNVDLWKVTDIKLTGSTPDPTPDPDPNPNPNPDPDPNPDPTPDPNPDPNPNPTPDPKPNPTPDPNPTPAPVLSNLTYNTRANAINNYYRWRDEYNNLQKRLGDLRMSKEENGLWARTFHGKEESGKYGLNNQYNAFQIGYDKQLLQDDGGKWFIGAAVTSYDGKTNYAKQGKADNNSIGLALYGSYLGEKGHYFDVVARHSRLKSELTSYAAGTGNKITGDYHNWGSSLSMEYGRRISMKHDFYLQPEAELTYGTTSSASYSLSDGSRVKQDGISSLTARAGLTVGKEFKNSNIFASISAVHDFGDDNVFSIIDKYGKTYKDISNLKDSWYELSVGGNVKFNNNTYIYADLEKTFGGDIQTKWRYNFGVRYSF